MSVGTVQCNQWAGWQNNVQDASIYVMCRHSGCVQHSVEDSVTVMSTDLVQDTNQCNILGDVCAWLMSKTSECEQGCKSRSFTVCYLNCAITNPILRIINQH